MSSFQSALLSRYSNSIEEYAVVWTCLHFCYLFPEKYEFYMEDIVRLWTAQGFVDEEYTAYAYFKEFQNHHIFQDSRFDYITGRPRYQINPPVFDHLQTKFGNDSEFFRADDAANWHISENTLHASICHTDTLNQLHHAKKLSTLLAHGNYFDQLPRDLFLKLPFLKILDLSNTRITNLPSSIGALKQLRYLNLSGTLISYLPNSLFNLFQLQTLKLKNCLNLLELPKDISKLKKLRHLDVDDAVILASMPLGFGNLVELRTLPAFVVGKEDGCHINELERMVNLRGSLRILMLENASSSKEAEAAALLEKRYIHSLEFHWTELHDGFDSLENLQAPLRLEELQIVGYGGAKFPKWIGCPLFSQLVTISLNNCRVCKLLPPLGALPSLKDLCTSHMHSIELIDHQFCSSTIDRKSLDLVKQKVETSKYLPSFKELMTSSMHRNELIDHQLRSSNIYGKRLVLVKQKVETSKDNNMLSGFPSLVKFTLNEMPMLIRWSGVEKGDFRVLQQLSISHCSKLTTIPKLSMLESLEQLEIVRCPLLDSLLDEDLPTSLQYLVIIDCPLLKEWCHKEKGSNLRKLGHVPNVWIDYERILQQEVVLDLSGNEMNSRGKASWIATRVPGVMSVGRQEDMSQLVVRGKGIDAPSLVQLMRKKGVDSHVISVTGAHNEEKENSGQS